MDFISEVKENVTIGDAKEENERRLCFVENHRKAAMLRG